MFKSFSKNRWIFLLVPAVVVGILVPFNITRDLVIFPGNNNMRITAYSDAKGPDDSDRSFLEITEDTTRTTISSYAVDSTFIDLEYKIGSKNIHPYAGFQWIVKKDQPYIDISDYDHITISINPNTTEDVIIIILQFFIEGFSNPADRMSWQYWSKELPLIKGKSIYTISLNEMSTPLWWYSQHKVTEQNLGKPTFHHLGMISVQNGSGIIGETRRIILNEIRFKKSEGYSRILFLTTLLVLYYAIFFSIIWLRRISKPPKKSPLTIPYEKLQINDDSIDEPRIFEYLGSHFSNQSLSLSRMGSDLNISTSKISAVIKKQYNLSFRQYLNTIRIAEAKRLLSETRMQVSQIAYKVGYTNLTHFSRTFKEVTSLAPNAFRSEFHPDPSTEEKDKKEVI
jgi:AraC-like DNA-binding protein